MALKILKLLLVALPAAFVLGGSTYGVIYGATHSNSTEAITAWPTIQQPPTPTERGISSLVSSFTMKVGDRVYISLPPSYLLVSKDPRLLTATLPKTSSSIQYAPEVIALAPGKTYLGVVDADTTLHEYQVTVTR